MYNIGNYVELTNVWKVSPRETLNQVRENKKIYLIRKHINEAYKYQKCSLFSFRQP